MLDATISRISHILGLRDCIISDIILSGSLWQSKDKMMPVRWILCEIEFSTPIGCGPKWVRLFFLCKEQGIL